MKLRDLSYKQTVSDRKVVEIIHECDDCYGTGKIEDEDCQECNGKGYWVERR